MTQTIDADFVRNQVRGHWLSVLQPLAPELEKAITKPGSHIPCPVHGGKDGFRLFRDAAMSGGGVCNTCGNRPDGFALLMWLRDWGFKDALTAVANVLGVNTDTQSQPRIKPIPVSRPPARDYHKVNAVMRKLWQQAVPITHQSAEPLHNYLAYRGLEVPLNGWSSLRFHPELKYIDENGTVIGQYPGLLGLIEKDGIPINMHRTFLTARGLKADVSAPKKLFPGPPGDLIGAAIRLGKPGRLLSVTEGIETALAVIEATGMVTWSLINTVLMASFLIPDGVEKLIIWADLDRNKAGLEAANALAAKAKVQGIEVDIRLPKYTLSPDVNSVDWLDVLNQAGPGAFAVRCTKGGRL